VLDLDFSPEQELLRETTRDVLERHCPLSVVRQFEDDPVGYPTELWSQLAKLDLIGLLLPESCGGSAMSLIEGVALYEEFGRALAPTPHFVSAVVSGWALARAGSQAQRGAWLPKVATGEAIITPAWIEPDGGFSALGVTTSASEGPGGIVLNGLKRHVVFAKAADQLLVLARSGPGATDVDLFLVDPQAPGVGLTQQFSIGSDTQYEVTLTDVVVDETARLGSAGTGWATWEDVMRDAVVLLGAQAVGGARYALEITVQYAKDRQQFDKPLGAFQALAHYLADAVTTVDGAEQLVHEAAWAGANGRETNQLAPMAKLYACRTFRDVTAMAQQVFGGIGFTVEFDIQLYFRRAKQLQVSWWDNRALEERIAAAILD
jgi:alkylation response protein AidB-like acyl-CoA dehydrogenase